MELILTNVRVGFPRLFTPEVFKESSAFSIKAFVERGSPQDMKIREAIKAEALAKWPKKWEFYLEEFRMDKKAYCYIDGDRVDFNRPENTWILTARRKDTDGRPMVVDQRKNPLAETDGKPYAGCYCNIKVEIYAQDGDNKGIRCGLIAVQFVKDGESFGGAKPATADGFDDLGDLGDTGDTGGSNTAGDDFF